MHFCTSEELQNVKISILHFISPCGSFLNWKYGHDMSWYLLSHKIWLTFMQIKIPTEIMSQIQKQTVFRSLFFFFFGCSTRVKSYRTLHIKTFDLLRFSIPLTSSKFCFKPKITSSVPIIMELFLEQSKCILENIILRLFLLDEQRDLEGAKA